MERKNIQYIFIDLDGTLIKTKSGRTFPNDVNDWIIKEDTWSALSKLASEKYLFGVHIISNQGGIEKGHVKEDEFITKIETISNLLQRRIGVPVSYDYCPTNDKDDINRKPNAGMIWDFLDYHNVVENTVIKYEQCLMIGDASGKEGQFSDSDKKCAENADIGYMDVDDFITWINND